MSTITDLRRERRKRNRKRMLKTLVIIILLIAAAAGSVFVYERYLKNGEGIPGLQQNELDISSSTSDSSKEGGTSLASGEPREIYSFDGVIGVLTDTEFTVYSTSGKTTLSYKHGLNKPQVHINGSYALLYDAGGRKAVIVTKNRVIQEQELEQSIIYATVSSEGYLGLALEGTSFGSQFSVYDTTQTEIFQWYTSDYQILSLDFYPGSKGAVVNCLGTTSGEKTAVLYTFQFDKQEPLARVEFQGSLILTTDFSSGQVFAAADNKCLVMKTKGDLNGEYAYGDNSPVLFAKSSGDYHGVVLQQYANNRTKNLIVLDNGCNPKATIPVSDVRDIYIDSDKIYVLSETLSCYDLSGNLVSQQTVDGSAHKITVVSGKVYLCTLSSLQKVELETVESSQS